MTTDWKYIYSEELSQKIAANKNGWVFTQDGVKYSPREIEILRKAGGITKQVHLIKKVFGCSIMELINE